MRTRRIGKGNEKKTTERIERIHHNRNTKPMTAPMPRQMDELKVAPSAFGHGNDVGHRVPQRLWTPWMQLPPQSKGATRKKERKKKKREKTSEPSSVSPLCAFSIVAPLILYRETSFCFVSSIALFPLVASLLLFFATAAFCNSSFFFFLFFFLPSFLPPPPPPSSSSSSPSS